jgi:hypothetical protein
VQLCRRLALVVSLVCPLAAWGQGFEEAPDDRAIDVQLFNPAVGPNAYLTVSGAQGMGKGRFQLALGVGYATKPLTVFTVSSTENPDLTTRSDVVSSLLTGDLIGAYGLTDALQIGVVLPLVFSMTGDGLDIGTGMPSADGLSARGLGDLRVEVLWRVLAADGIAIAAIPGLTVPTSVGLGSDSEFLGDDLPTFRPRGALEWTSHGGSFSGALNLGFAFRKPRTLYSSDVSHEFTYGVGTTYRFSEKLQAIAELFGHIGFASDVDQNPLEIDGAVRFSPTPMFGVQVGGGTGLVRGIGAPGLRLFAAVSWSPDTRDSDKDGISNSRDKCPAGAEDKDGYKDDDGCPDEDNDSDLLADGEDKCPTDAEDKDGFEDDDGCPERDNDRDGYADFKDACPDKPEDKKSPRPDDGCPADARDSDGDSINDLADKCPNEAEDADHIADEDGCPETDADADGLTDDVDGCPAIAEDKDGTADDDGCPDADDDNDGVDDAADKCPKQAETINGVSDDDGCPDRGGAVLISVAAPTLTPAKPVRWEGEKVNKRYLTTLDQMAAVMRQHRGVGKWRIVVAVKSEGGRDLAQKRADWVVAYLAQKGVPATKLEASGAVGEKEMFLAAAIEGEMSVPQPPEEPVIEIE